MFALTKIVCLFLPLLLLSSCSNSEEPDYPAVASSISNSILINILDLDGNSLLDNKDFLNGVSLIGKNGYKIPFHIVAAGRGKLISTNFPLPMESSMNYSDDRNEAYGKSALSVNVNGIEFDFMGMFHYTCTYPNIYGGSAIKIIEVISNDPNVSITEVADVPKITIKI